MDLQLQDKVAIVTAASKGLGKAAALALAREGARIMMCSRSDSLFQTADEIRDETNVEVAAIRADITDKDDIEALVRTTLERFGQIDILIINAGGPSPGTFLSLNPEDWEVAIRLTLMSAIWLCYAVLPHMIERGTGSIVATESVAVKQPIDNLILSNSIRLAVLGMLKSLANEVGPKGIRVNSINPSLTWTSRVEQLMRDRANRLGTTVEEEIAKATADVPLRRLATIEEYGRTIAWLASPAASYIHGHALMFDGGIVSTPL